MNRLQEIETSNTIVFPLQETGQEFTIHTPISGQYAQVIVYHDTSRMLTCTKMVYKDGGFFTVPGNVITDPTLRAQYSFVLANEQ